MPELLSGQLLDGRFELLRRLGAGGMAEVWLVRDSELGENVVAKVLPPEPPADRVALLRRECRHARRLVHPNIARVYEFHGSGERVYLTMEYVDGPDLGHLRERPLAEFLPALTEIAEALAYAHAQGVIHRDLKASNVVCDRTGRPRLIDFGIAGLLEAGDDLQLRGGGSRYSMSPQQRAGEEAGPADDLYAFGVLLYELACGRPPLRPEAEGERARHDGPRPMRTAHPVPGAYRALVDRLLAPSPDDRPRDMREVAERLRAISHDLAHPGPGDVTAPGRPVPRLNPPPRPRRIEPVAPASVRGTAETATSAGRSRRWLPLGSALLAVGLTILALAWLQQRAPGTGSTGVGAGPAAAGGMTTDATLPPAALTERTGNGTAVPGREEAERLLSRLTELRRGLAERGAETWGGEAFLEAGAHADTGDELLGRAEYASAVKEYATAAELFERVAGASTDALQHALDQGERALAAGDRNGAGAAFALAARIDPGNSTAATGLRRAEVVERVEALLARGSDEERAGDWIAADRAYRQAAGLDPLSLAAQQGLARTTSRVEGDHFTAAMSRALAALEQRSFSEAREAFDEAGALRPGSPEVAQGLLQLAEEEKLDAIAADRQRAIEDEHAERWKAAEEAYVAVTQIDPTLAFARLGAERCRLRADLERRIVFNLDHPERLASDEVFDEATALLVEARNVESPGPRHLEQVERLQALVQSAGSRVQVRLESDNLTQVLVYHVGQLGAFLTRELQLRPGRYTVVGSRPGYRDVRYELVVVAGHPPDPLAVRCEEPI